MSEYIIRETGYPGTLTQEIVGELVRCKDCVHFSKGSEEFWIENDCDFHEWYHAEPKEDDYCSRGERKDE